MSVLRVKRPFDNIFDPFTESHCTGHVAKKEYFPSFATSQFALTADQAISAQSNQQTQSEQATAAADSSASRKRFRPPSPHFTAAAPASSSTSSSSLWSIDYDDDTMTPSSPPTQSSSYRRSPTREPSPFATANVAPMNVDRFIQTKRHKHATTQQQAAAASSPVYTAADVRRMLSDALTSREREIREEYDRVLSELLREQFEHFNRFNKDYISKQINKNELSYLS